MRSELWLTRQAARGDREAFAAIFRRHQQDLYRYCVAILGDPDGAQDALQNTMVKALRALPGERREIALKPWLYRIAHNEAIELRRRERPVEPLADVELPAGTSLEQMAAERGRLRELLADLALLPDRQRGALVMRELAGFDFDEIGAALATTPAAARQVLYEARQGLREMGQGREMRCDAVTAILSDGDGRVARRRDVRAHLRACPDCGAFAEEIRTRGEAFAAIAPLPALAAAAMVKGALAASAGSTAGGGVTGAGAGSAGLVAGAAAKAGTTATLLKSAIGVVAIAAAGAVAADRAHVVDLGGPGGARPAATRDGGGGPGRSSTSRGTAKSDDVSSTSNDEPASRQSNARALAARRRDLTDAGADVGAASDARHRTGAGPANGAVPGGPVPAYGAVPVGPGPGITLPGTDLIAATGAPDPAKPAPAGAPTAAGSDSADPSADGQAPGADHSPSAAGTVHPPHPAHPAHPAHPDHPAKPAHPAHPAHPTHPTHPAHPDHPGPPDHSDDSAHPAQPAQPANPGPSGNSDHPEHPAHPVHPPHPEHPAPPASEAPPKVVPGPGAEPAAPPSGPPGKAAATPADASPSESAPGQVRKAAEEESTG